MNFDEFLKKQNEQNAEKQAAIKAINPAERICRFQTLIKDLYAKIDTVWLKEYFDSGMMHTGEAPVAITEESLGTYQVLSKWIEIAGQRISILPVGTILIGTDARLDMSYRGDERMIVHVEDEWRVVDRDLRVKYTSLDAGSFKSVIMELMK